MSDAKEFTKVWSTLSQKILASILIDDGAVFEVHNKIGSNSQWFAKKERPLYEAILGCLADNTPPTIEAVTVRINGNTPPGYIQSIAGLFNDEDNRHLIYNVEELQKLGVLAEVRTFGRNLADLDKIDDISKTTDNVTTKLGGILAGASTRQSDAASISDLAWQEVEKAQEPGVPTGLKWFDNLTGGLWRGMNYQIVGAYKQGKSTIMRNAVLYAAGLNNPVGVFCAEGSREMFTLDCQAMLATGLLLDQGLRGEALKLNGLGIRRYYWQSGVFTNRELEAIHEAREIWRGLPVHIWDTKDQITNLSTLRYLVKRGRVHHGISSFWADYSQLFGEGNIYERQSSTALTVQNIAQTENVAFCMLNQKNEEGVKGSGGYSPNVKGGGDAAAAADFLLVPKIDGDTPCVIDVELKLTRHSRAGSGMHLMAPSSGLIIDKYN